MRALLAITSLLLTGCLAPLSELRTMPPARQLEASGRYDIIAACVADGLQTGPTSTSLWISDIGDLRLQVVRRDDFHTMTVTAFVAAPQAPPQFDLTFRQEGDRVRVEERHDDHLAPPRRLSAQAWKVVERCAGGK